MYAYTEDTSMRDQIKQEVVTMLGYGMVRVELTDDALELAVNLAIDKFRQKASNAYEEAWLELNLQMNQSVYTLPNEVEHVRKIFRRGNGVVAGTQGTMDPFALAYANSYLQSAVRGSSGGLLTYELQHSFDKTAGRMFGREIIFQWNPVSKQLTLNRDIRGGEEVMLWSYILKPEEMIFKDHLIRPWLRDWTLAECKIILGRVRGKISAIPGPNGAINLNGDALVKEGMAEKEYLLDQLKRYGTGSMPLSFIFG